MLPGCSETQSWTQYLIYFFLSNFPLCGHARNRSSSPDVPLFKPGLSIYLIKHIETPHTSAEESSWLWFCGPGVWGPEHAPPGEQGWGRPLLGPPSMWFSSSSLGLCLLLKRVASEAQVPGDEASGQDVQKTRGSYKPPTPLFCPKSVRLPLSLMF